MYTCTADIEIVKQKAMTLLVVHSEACMISIFNMHIGIVYIGILVGDMMCTMESHVL